MVEELPEAKNIEARAYQVKTNTFNYLKKSWKSEHLLLWDNISKSLSLFKFPNCGTNKGTILSY